MAQHMPVVIPVHKQWSDSSLVLIASYRKLDELTARQHLMSPWSLSVISGSHCSSLDNTAKADFPPSIRSVCLLFGAIGQFLAEI